MNFLRPSHPLQLAPPVTAHADSALNQISLEYTYGELQQATRNFDPSMKLGSGSYGGVYKGVLKDGTEVAIKVLDVPDEAGFEEEVKVLSKFRHPNLVILMGFARHGTQRSLVYEILQDDVHKRLHRSCVEGVAFPWKERVSIALDAACGLSHLHNSSPKVFHRDIKTPNILLDKNGTAKMADFGLACLSHASAHRVKQASGTIGYACPLYVQRGVVTEGSEVYSFGMVLLELLTASPPAYVGNGSAANQIQYLANHIKGDINIVLSLVDTKAQWTPPAARAVGDFALNCINMQEEKRPNFAEIVRTMRALHDGSSLAGTASAAGVTAAAALRQPSPVAVAQAPAPAAQPGALVHCPQGQGVVGQAFPGAHRPHSPNVAPSPQPGAASLQGGRPVSPPKLPQAALLQAPTPQALQAGRRTVTCHRQDSPTWHSPHGGYSVGVVGGVSEVEKASQQATTVMKFPAIAPEKPPPQQAPSLFTLECVFSEGISLHDVPREQRLIVHRLASEDDPVCGAPFPPLRVGRIFQTALFDALVADGSARSTISREHFQVWAEEAPSPPISCEAGDTRLPCTFCLTNFSGNGTHINDDHLQARGERSILRHGDVITLSRSVTGPEGTYQARFVQFRFDLSESCLREAEWFDAGASPRSECSEERRPLSEDELQSTPNDDSGYEGELAFFLEVCGPAVHEAPLEQRRLGYSPPLEEEGAQPHLYSALFVGRAHQLDFWQEVLHNEAFNTLSRQHFEVQTWRSGVSGSEARFSFLVRNLSDVNPIHVRGGPEETTEDPPSMLAKGEQRHLLDGDEIVLNWNQDHTFWLIFRDLTQSTSVAAPLPSRFQYGLEETSAAFEARSKGRPFEIGPANIAGVGTAAEQRSVTSSSRKGHGAAVLRPPVSLLKMKDEDEISTTATPHDLYHDEQEEEEDEEDDCVTHVSMGLSKASGHAVSLRRRANSDVCQGGGRSTLSHGSSGLVRDARGVREDHRRNFSPANLAGSSPPAYRHLPWARQRCRAP